MPAKRVPLVRDYMTPLVHTIGRDQTLETAHRLMRRFRIRHLPVLERGKLVGILSLRDLNLIETLPDVVPAEVTVEDAMVADPYLVPPDAKLRDVVEEMAKRKLGSVLIVQGKRLAGVLTTVDALRALLDALDARSPKAQESQEASP
jgi:acetoin utilization protein AcuB